MCSITLMISSVFPECDITMTRSLEASLPSKTDSISTSYHMFMRVIWNKYTRLISQLEAIQISKIKNRQI